MALRIAPCAMEHLPYLRLLYHMFVTEQDPAYPIIDDEELDQFVLTLSRHITHNPTFGGWVALRGKRVVGFLAGDIETRPIGRPHIYGLVWWLYVVPKHRHTGVALGLIDAGITWAHERDVTHIEVSANAGDDQWAQRGWTPVTTTYMMPVTTVRLRPQRRLQSNGLEARHG